VPQTPARQLQQLERLLSPVAWPVQHWWQLTRAPAAAASGSQQRPPRRAHPPGTCRLQGGWRNLITARTMFEIITYHPMRHLSGITAPVLLRGGLRDKLCTIANIREAAAALGQ
jgi:hypothetical protein